MNQAQFGLFIVYVFSVLSAGLGVYGFLARDKEQIINRFVYLGEALLLGSIFAVGELLILSLLGLYRAPLLWAAVLVNFAFLLNKDNREDFYLLIAKKINIEPALIIFIGLILIFIFRNCYFLVDIDSHTTYLFTQKLWLSSRTSLIGDIGKDIMIFFPQFDTISYSLGIGLFGQETLFPQLINLFWRLIVLLLVFGYTSYRFNRYYGLAAVMLVLWNDHFFYSGVNRWVLINGAIIGFLFAAAYNFWESKVQDSPFRFILALVFISQLMANKYQIAYVAILLLMLGILIQDKPFGMVRSALAARRYLTVLIIALIFASLWYVKNAIITGVPTFPILAGKFRAFNWTPEREYAFIKAFGGLKLSLFFKYMNYLFIWPGINAAKYVILVVSLLPIFIFWVFSKGRADKSVIMEISFWLSASILLIMGTCIASHWDPRYYRYSIGVLSFAVIFSLHFVLSYVINIKNQIVLAAIILLISLRGGNNEGFKIIFDNGGFFKRPSPADNINVILNRIHTKDVINNYYPQIPMILNDIMKNNEKFNKAAWNMGSAVNFPAFLLPIRPMLSLWRTTIVRWDSFGNKYALANDLRKYGIEWVMTAKDDKLLFVSPEDYGVEAEKYDLHPQKLYFDYDFPPELSRIQR